VSHILTIEPEAEAEIAEASAWYDERSKAVRESFIRAIDRALSLIQQQPEQFQVVSGQIRRVMIGGFPYALFYRAFDREVNVVACFHCRRDPKQWQGRRRR
jgi:plasmid stabilization system protein ParE